MAVVPPRSSSEPKPAPEKAGRSQARLYFNVVATIVLLIVLVALVVANLQAVEVDWLLDSADISLVWVILASAVIGWLLGVVTASLARRR